MKSILEKNIGKLICLISKVSPWYMIIGRIVEVLDGYIRLNNAIWYGRDNYYVTIALFSNTFKSYLEIFLKSIKDPKIIFEMDVSKYVDVVMEDISKRVINSAMPEIIPLFSLKGININSVDYIIQYDDFILLEIENLNDPSLVETIESQIKILYGSKTFDTSNNIVVDKEGNA